MKILIADILADTAIKELEALGAEVTVNPDLAANNICDHIKGKDILIVRSTKVTKETIDAADNLSLIIRAGAGVNTIDISSANAKGIYVANCPGKNTDAVAELTIGLLVSADRRIVNASVDLRNGRWRKKEYGKSQGLKGRTLGVIGVGRVGRAVIKRIKGFEMDIIGYSRSLTPEKADKLAIGYCASIGELAEKSDAISLHLAANDETKHIINNQFFKKMKKGAILINTSRGEIIKTTDLIDAIKTKAIRFGADVFENEPTKGEADFAAIELVQLCTATPHIGASTNQSTEAVAGEVINIVKALKETGTPPNVVNLRAISGANNT